MRFQEEAVCARRRSGHQQRRHVLAHSSARSVRAAPRLLCCVSGVEQHHGTGGGPQPLEAAHVHDQVTVAEGRATLGHRDVTATRGPHLLGSALHLLGGHPLALLDVHRPTRAAHRIEQVRLAAQERGDLQRVHGRRHGLHLPHFVHVGEDRQAGFVTHAPQRCKALIDSGAPRSPRAAAVGLVEAGLVHDAKAELRLELGQLGGHGHVHRIALHNARTRDQGRRRRPESAHVTCATPWVLALGALPRLRLTAAPTKLANSGWGSIGRDLSSGWNWHPMNHG